MREKPQKVSLHTNTTSHAIIKVMEYCKDKQYFVIETLRRNDFSAAAIHKILKEALPEECLSEHRVRCIVQEYREENQETI